MLEPVYFLLSPTCRKVKIGRSYQINTRTRTLYCLGPDEKLTLVGIDTQRHENQWHFQYRKLRSHGEWFWLDPIIDEHYVGALLRDIEKLRVTDVDPDFYPGYSSLVRNTMSVWQKYTNYEIRTATMTNTTGLEELPEFIPSAIRLAVNKPNITDRDRAEFARLSLKDPTPVSEEVLTPALMWLAICSSRGNRKILMADINKLMTDMKSDSFYSGNDMMMFGDKGNLSNAHHRAIAALICGKSIKLWVRRRVADVETQAIDTGRKRNLDDSEAMKGNAPNQTIYNEINARVIRVMLNRGQQDTALNNLSHNTIRVCIDKYENGLLFINNILNQYPKDHLRRVALSVVRAVFLRAYYTRNENGNEKYNKIALERGLRFMIEGEPLPGSKEGEFKSLHVYRDALLKTVTNTCGTGQRKEYRRISKALWNFLHEIKSEKSYEATEELFPIGSLNFLPDVRQQTGSVPDVKAVEDWGKKTPSGVYRLKEIAKGIWFNEPDLILKKYKEKFAEVVRRKGILQVTNGEFSPIKVPGQLRVALYQWTRHDAA